MRCWRNTESNTMSDMFGSSDTVRVRRSHAPRWGADGVFAFKPRGIVRLRLPHPRAMFSRPFGPQFGVSNVAMGVVGMRLPDPRTAFSQTLRPRSDAPNGAMGIVGMRIPHPLAMFSRSFRPRSDAPNGGMEHSPGMSAAIPWEWHPAHPSTLHPNGVRERAAWLASRNTRITL